MLTLVRVMATPTNNATTCNTVATETGLPVGCQKKSNYARLLAGTNLWKKIADFVGMLQELLGQITL